MEKLDLVEEAKKKKARELVIGIKDIQHRHYNVIWKLTEDEQATIDEDAKMKYDEAMVAREKPEMAMAQLKQSVADMDAPSEEVDFVGRVEVGDHAEQWHRRRHN
ncbi:uncharacterized protein FIBRA_08769 [Fibroporia radiculosa]|uniref:Uncharacterized protein n=1 Tax=Fibroporia radiculosa TaxID=599839 RepID=J4H5C5_9APHY|nr:uncharacterized protein FIBRA_08769 [Fibroporia radiculosa]CCM06499.1 predicted protein [Fibroporia radiculosa]